MENVSLLVHRVNNNIENVEVLLEEDNLDKEASSLIGKIIDEQMNNILQNSELYYFRRESEMTGKDVCRNAECRQWRRFHDEFWKEPCKDDLRQ